MRYNRVKILKKSRLGRRASSHVMRWEQEQCVAEVQKTEYNWSTVIEGQSRVKRLKLERQRWGLVGTCEVRTWILSYVQWRATRWFDKGKQYSLISVLESSLNVVNCVGSEECQAPGTIQVWSDDDWDRVVAEGIEQCLIEQLGPQDFKSNLNL